MPLNLFELKSDWKRPKNYPDLPAGPMAIDLETCDPYLKKICPGYVRPLGSGGWGHPAGYAISVPGEDYYFPVRHGAGENFNIEEFKKWFQIQLDKPGPKIFANATYDLGWMKREGLHVKPEEIHDVQVQAPLLDENKRSYSLDNLAKEYLGEEKDEKLLKEATKYFGLADPKADMWRLPPEYVGPYAEIDSNLTLRLWLKFQNMIEHENLEEVYNLERALIPTLLDIKIRGIRVDQGKLEQLYDQFKDKERHAMQEIRALSGRWVRPYAASEIAGALDIMGIGYDKTNNGVPSITVEYLETLDHPIGGHIRDARKFQKGHQTFLKNYIMDRLVVGRIHCSFNQLRSDEGGTVSGRFSCSSPNLQNLPSRDPIIGPAVRGLFLPEMGEKWLAADYANQEPRILVHWASKCQMDGSHEAVAKFREDPRVSYHRIVEEEIKDYVPDHLDSYKAAKQINLAIMYGMGGGKLCEGLGLPTQWKNPGKNWEVCKEGTPGSVKVAGEVGEKLLKVHKEKVPFAKALAKLAEDRAKKKGFIRTLSGRKCRFDGFEYKALNRLIQGSAADQTKYAMVEMAKAGHTILLTMHDELGLSVKSIEEAREVKEIMENAYSMRVPFKCDMDYGPSWGQAKEIDLD